MENTPHWATYLSALSVPVVAVLGVYIAYQQWRLSQNKLKLDLFDRRFAVYDAARTLIDTYSHAGDKELRLLKFPSVIREAKWLLNEEVAQYLDKHLANANAFACLQAELDGIGVGEVRTKKAQEMAEIGHWFCAQYEELDKHFTPFLQLQHGPSSKATFTRTLCISQL
ncbi:MAG: hypothetical protein WAN92_02400, partial [Herbaspirillum sp.]